MPLSILPRPLLGLVVAAPLALLLALSAAGCELFRCGYGGPGCGLPALLHLCQPTLAVDETVETTVVYYDDTDGWPAGLRRATSDDPALEVALGQDPGTLTLTGRSVGVATLTLEIDGWDTPQTWTFTVQAAHDEAHADDCEEAALSADS
jgi:hypothetical protein